MSGSMSNLGPVVEVQIQLRPTSSSNSEAKTEEGSLMDSSASSSSSSSLMGLLFLGFR
uniref:Uncharacterized protein n=1 Tax=Denticeps clupeoides TaxID=299321 RepID=A0AAY4AB06_9TELE